MRSKVLCVFWLFIAIPLFSNPFLGKWKMELIAAANPYILEFIDGSTYSLLEVNINDLQYLDYSIDEKSQTINLGKINNIALGVRYSFNKNLDVFSLFFKDEMIDNELIGALGFDSTDSLGNPIPETVFTQDFIGKFKKGFSDLVKSLPIAVGKKLK
jgi:hypothetical protein